MNKLKNNILDKIFIKITKEDRYNSIPKLLSALFGDLSEIKEINSVPSLEFMDTLLKRFPRPFTIVNENYHIDSSYRDTYYMYFSNQHFEVPRYSRRFSFFTGIVDYRDFINANQFQNKLQDKFMGACVFNPLGNGLIGRTLINPSYVIEQRNFPIYVRTSTFKINVLGQPLTVDAFPYRMQDQETMSCTEVTLINMLEYYSNSYIDYRTVSPSEIIEHEQMHSYERVLPSKGMTYPILTRVLADFGFSPRLYNSFAIRKHNFSKISQRDELKRWLHYYIESGIPVAVNLNPIGNYGPGHSVVCIGHGGTKDSLKKKARESELLLWNRRSDHPIINSADFYEDYIIMDDNQFLYQMQDFNSLSLYPDMQVVNLAVPLYKRMFLDAPDAADIIIHILQHDEYGITAWAGEYLEPNESVVIRIFMASSRSFKKFRIDTMKGLTERILYSNMRLPRFIWVCELYRYDEYEKEIPEAFGEILVDATSASNRGPKSLLMMHYPGVITIRTPEYKDVGRDYGFDWQYNLPEVYRFEGYHRNLTNVRKCKM